MEVLVEYEYLAQEPDELNLKVGDIITDVVRVQEGWCEGILNGVKGVFPDNFVKVDINIIPALILVHNR